MKIKKTWQENLVKLKLTHLRQYLPSPTRGTINSEIPAYLIAGKQTTVQHLEDVCSQLKKSTKFFQECSFRNHSMIKVGMPLVSKNCGLPLGLRKRNLKKIALLSTKEMPAVITVLDDIILSERNIAIQCRKNHKSITYFHFFDKSSIVSQKNTGTFTCKALELFYASLLQKHL